MTDWLEACPGWAFAQWLMGRPVRTYLEFSHIVEQHNRMLLLERARAGSGIGQPIPDACAADSLVSPQTPSRTVSSFGPEPVDLPAAGPRSRALQRFIED